MSAMGPGGLLACRPDGRDVARSGPPGQRGTIGTDAAWYLVPAGSAAITAVVFRPQLEKLALPGLSGAVGWMHPASPLVVAVAVFDAVAFWVHGGLHRSERLWAFHKVHHLSLHLDAPATTRTHLFE